MFDETTDRMIACLYAGIVTSGTEADFVGLLAQRTGWTEFPPSRAGKTSGEACAYGDDPLPAGTKEAGPPTPRPPLAGGHLDMRDHPMPSSDSGLAFLATRSEPTLALQALLVATQSLAAVCLAMVEREHNALLLLGPGGRVMHATEKARALLAMGPGLSIRNDRLRADCSATQKPLQHLIDRCSRDPAEVPADSLLVNDHSGTPRLALSALPLRPASTLPGHTEPVRVGIVIRPLKPRATMDCRVACRYRLTPAETRLARSLICGFRISDHCLNAGISTHTARTQLKSLFAKTGTNTQSQLIQLLRAADPDPGEPPLTAFPRAHRQDRRPGAADRVRAMAVPPEADL